MRIAFFSNDFPPNLGGIAEVGRRLCEELARRGHEVHVVTHRPVGVRPDEAAPPYAVHRLFPPYPQGVLRSAGGPWRLIRWRAAARRAVEAFWPSCRPEVLLAGKYSPFYPMLFRRLPCPLLLLLHGQEVGGALAGWRPLRRRGLRRTVRRAAWTFCNSAYTLGLLRRLCGRDVNASATGCGYPVEQIVADPDRAAARRALGWDDAPVLLTVARLVPRKGIDTTIRALELVRRHLPDCRYVVAGDGPARPALERLARETLGDGCVRFLGRVDEPTRRNLYLAGDLFVMPSRTEGGVVEGFGISFLEANAHGLAAVGSKAGGIPDAVVHDQTGLLVEPDDPAALAGAVVELLEDPARRRRMALAGQEMIRRRYNWPAIVDEMEPRLREAAVAAGPRGA